VRRDTPSEAEARIRRPGRRFSGAGLTLVEVLVAVSVSAIALGGAWPWLWDSAAASRRLVEHTQASTSAAFALRCLSDDLSVGTALLPLPPGVAPSGALQVMHTHTVTGPEPVVIEWDPVRRVLWRKAPGTYLADHVTSFCVAYFDAAGAPVQYSGASSDTWPSTVARVSVSITVSVGGATSTAGRSFRWPVL